MSTYVMPPGRSLVIDRALGFICISFSYGEVIHCTVFIAKDCMQVMDLMGFEPSHWNKINIHIGGVYGNKLATLDRFAENYERLSANCKARLTLENDDRPSAFAVKDLLPLSRKCNIPIVFDFHHHKFCSGGCMHRPPLPCLLPMTVECSCSDQSPGQHQHSVWQWDWV